MNVSTCYQHEGGAEWRVGHPEAAFDPHVVQWHFSLSLGTQSVPVDTVDTVETVHTVHTVQAWQESGSVCIVLLVLETTWSLVWNTQWKGKNISARKSFHLCIL